MGHSWQQRGWKIGLTAWVGSGGGLLAPGSNYVCAQLVPDNTLGAESSVVTPLDAVTNQIDGGAVRGINLFHSFGEFNVTEGQGVYFANPQGIENILTRVTGSNPSNIFGILGVLGNANLFLLNPNGIIFGENATLDINGSFVATTADAIQLGETGIWSATSPQTSSLLAVSPGALFFNQVGSQQATITNRGTLATGQNLTLAAGNLDLQGQLQARENLTLQALDTVIVRDSATHPFIASAGGELLVQGDAGVDIFALNHPSSGFYSGGDMVLRSQSPVIGDAYYTTGGDFRIEQPDSSLGNLVSLVDPIIRASGDVSFTSYTGASLHILAGGAVNIGSIRITGTDATNAINQTITLSDGTPVAIDGSARPTLDIRAGTTAVTNPSGSIGNPTPTGLSLTGTPTSADITIGSITVSAANGLVLLTNQYSPNPSLTGGTIRVGSINTSSFSGDSGDVVIDSRSDIVLAEPVNASSLQGNGGDITLLAGSDIYTSDIYSLGLLGGSITFATNGTLALDNHLILSASIIPSTPVPGLKGGDITINARELSLTNGARIITATLGAAGGGNLIVNAAESVELSGTDDGLLADISAVPQLDSLFLATLPPNGASALERILGSGLLAVTLGTGSGGNVTIETGRLSVRDGSEITASTFNQGDGGNIMVNASNLVELIGTTPSSIIGGLFATTYAGGDAGDITINTRQLIARDGASATASNLVGTGDGGNLTVTASEFVELSGTSPNGQVPSNLSAGSAGSAGDAGDVTVNTPRLIIRDGAGLVTATNGSGQGGDLTVNASSVELSGTSANGFYPSFIVVDTFSQMPDAGKAGELTINTGRLIVRDGAVVSASTWGAGQGGNLIVNATEFVELSGTSDNGGESGLYAQGFGAGDAGNLQVTTPALSVRDGAKVTVAATDVTTDFRLATGSLILAGFVPVTFPDRSTGNAGEMTIQADSIELDNGSLTASSIRAGGGNINVTANDIELRNSSPITTSVANSTGGGGDIKINSNTFVALEDSDILANADAGAGGNITINSEAFLANLFATGQATDVGNNPGDFSQFRGNNRVDISASSRVGISGTVSVPDFSFLQNSLSALSANFVNPEQAIASSCLARRNAVRGSFTVTGTGNLPTNPYDDTSGRYPVSEVQGLSPQSAVPNPQSPAPNPATGMRFLSRREPPTTGVTQSPIPTAWKLGDPVQEAKGMIVTAEGRIVAGTAVQVAPREAEHLVCQESDRSTQK